MNNRSRNLSLVLGVVGVFLAIAALFARTVFPEYVWLTVLFALLFAADLGYLLKNNQDALRSRSVAYGANSAVTILLVLGIVGVLNFLVSRYPQKLDMTRNKVNTLSEQTVKLVKGMSHEVQATVYAKAQAREQLRPILDNYRSLNPKFLVEYVDPDKEPTRAKAAGIKKYGTVVLSLDKGKKESRIDPELTEEKLTNAMIKLLKDKTTTLCAVTGHGERSFNASEAEGMSAAKKSLGDQSYEVKDLSLISEKNTVPASCDAVAVIGPTKAFFAPEIKALSDYLAGGGRLMVAFDINVKGGGEYSPELIDLISRWNIKPMVAMIVDPVSRMLGVDASVPLLAEFNQSSPLTKDFRATSFFPFSRPLDLTSTTPGITPVWLAKTSAKSWGITDIKSLSTGTVSPEPGKDLQGPLTVAASVDGKPQGSKAPRNTRLVVFGSASFATNYFSRYGGNMDFFLNSVSWLLEDESLISIRAKEEGPSRIELSAKAGYAISWLTVILIPLAIAVGGVVIWAVRRRL